jgi:hypothetical protein
MISQKLFSKGLDQKNLSIQNLMYMFLLLDNLA